RRDRADHEPSLPGPPRAFVDLRRAPARRVFDVHSPQEFDVHFPVDTAVARLLSFGVVAAFHSITRTRGFAMHVHPGAEAYGTMKGGAADTTRGDAVGGRGAAAVGQLELVGLGPAGADGRRALPPEAEMHRAYMERDTRYDGIFFTAVRTTGIFCRPSCTAKKPRRENVEFY